MKNLLLRRELKRQGATSKDAESMLSIAQVLSLDVPSLPAEVKKQIAHDIGFKPQRQIIKPRFAIAGATAAFVVLIVLSQSAQPGSTLYALKRGSEEVRTVVQPGFNHEDLQQRREDERNKAAEIQQKQEDKRGESGSQDAAEDSSRSRHGSQRSGQNQTENSSNVSEQESGSSGSGSGSGDNRTDTSGSGSSGSGSGSSGSSRSGRGSGQD
jgi:hypothetical protein